MTLSWVVFALSYALRTTTSLRMTESVIARIGGWPPFAVCECWETWPERPPRGSTFASHHQRNRVSTDFFGGSLVTSKCRRSAKYCSRLRPARSLASAKTFSSCFFSLFSFFRKSFIVRAPAALATIVAHLRHARMPSAVRFPETLLLIFPGASKGLSGAQTSPRTAKAQFHLQATIGSLFLFALARFGFQQELLANTLRDRMQACRQLEAPAFNRNLRHLLRRVLESLQCIRLLRIE